MMKLNLIKMNKVSITIFSIKTKFSTSFTVALLKIVILTYFLELSQTIETDWDLEPFAEVLAPG